MKYVVGFSGGIDSQAAANWAIDTHGSENTILLNSDPGGNEHPMTTEFLHWFSENVHPVQFCKPLGRDMFSKDQTVRDRGFDPDQEISFGDLAKARGRFPSRKAQFCTEVLKFRPALRWAKENLAGVEYERVTGVRRDESAGRADTPEREWDDWFGCWCNHPLFDWTKQKCFDYCIGKGQKVNPLYSLGFNRVGCAPCINSGRGDIRNWNKRFPQMIDKIRAWEKQAGRTFFPPMVPGMEINFVDDVVAWANCEHGGKQFSLDVYMPSPMCESKFGLCE